MSFKRAGDDHYALRYQKKQRVTDLLAEDIPADEATQTRSGRFACLVCPHNPVLDTMAMLTLHRQGKKHLANMAIKIEKEHDLSELFQKRKQETYLKEEGNSSSLNTENSNSHSRNACTPGPLLERTRQLTEAIRDHSQSVTYDKSKGETLDHERSTLKTPGKNTPFFQSRVEMHLSEKPFKNSRVYENSSTLSCEKKTDSGTLISATDSLQGECADKRSSDFKKNSVGKVRNTQDVVAKNKRLTQEQQRYLELKKSGWILDRNGKWIKDDNAEFDSDEDEPPSGR